MRVIVRVIVIVRMAMMFVARAIVVMLVRMAVIVRMAVLMVMVTIMLLSMRMGMIVRVIVGMGVLRVDARRSATADSAHQSTSSSFTRISSPAVI
jgi:hypothetical protein